MALQAQHIAAGVGQLFVVILCHQVGSFALGHTLRLLDRFVLFRGNLKGFQIFRSDRLHLRRQNVCRQ